MKVAKGILRYIRGTLHFILFYSCANKFELVGYTNNDWGGNQDDGKSTSFVFFLGSVEFTWSYKKQNIVSLFTCEAKYVVASSEVCHILWLRNLLKSIKHLQGGPTIMHIDYKLAIALVENPSIMLGVNILTQGINLFESTITIRR